MTFNSECRPVLPAHSKLGASGMHRWAPCPGSVKLSEGIESPTSVYAAEGTVAHGIAADCLTGVGASPSRYLDQVIAQDGHDIQVTEEMIEAIDTYLIAVRNAYSSDPVRPVQLVEHKFHLKQIHPDLFGTADCVQYFPSQKLLKVYDYKHGAGVAVKVDKNKQLLYYALGALLTCNFPAVEVVVVVVQPRCPHPDGPVREYGIDATELLDFSADLLDAVKRTEQPNAPLNPGDWCRWCPAAAICPALKGKAQELAKREFTVDTYDTALLADTLTWLPIFEGWASGVRQFAYAELEHGRGIPGWKLVQKRPTRKWVDEHTAEIELQKLGVSESDLYEPQSIKSPAQIDKVLGKQKKKAEPLWIKKSSGNKLAPESDPGEAVTVKTAAQEFGASP